MNHIHPTATIEHGAQIDATARVGPYCYIGPRVKIGANTRLVAHATVLGHTTLGENNTIWPYSTLGADPQDLKYQGEDTQLIIGHDNSIRESVTMHTGTIKGGGVTRVGDHNLFMVGCHIAHDCQIGNHIVMANTVNLAGHIHIEDHVVISGATAIHHFVTLGQYAFIGGVSRIVHDVPPYLIVEGNPSSIRGVNTIGLTRHHFSERSVEVLKDAYRRLYRKNSSDGQAHTISNGIKTLEKDYPNEPCIKVLTQAIRRSSVGLFGRYLEGHRSDKRYKSTNQNMGPATVV